MGTKWTDFQKSEDNIQCLTDMNKMRGQRVWNIQLIGRNSALKTSQIWGKIYKIECLGSLVKSKQDIYKENHGIVKLLITRNKGNPESSQRKMTYYIHSEEQRLKMYQ